MTAAEPNVLDETPATLAQIAARANQGRVTMSALRKVRRWIADGVTIRGEVVRLDAQRVGGKYVTSVEAFDRFLAACNSRPAPAAPDRTPTQMRRDSEAASRKLKRMLARDGIRPLPEGV